jgi:hypothetical protein
MHKRLGLQAVYVVLLAGVTLSAAAIVNGGSLSDGLYASGIERGSEVLHAGP